MYESPLKMMCDNFTNQIIKQEEDKIICEIRQAVGYDIDKRELIKALQYDRNQYKKGYADAMAVIDAIKQEIEGTMYGQTCYCSDGIVDDILEIIDKHTKGGDE